MIDTAKTLKTMTAKQAAYFTGKRVDSMKWDIPEWYARCEETGKMYPESQLLVTFPHHAFTKAQMAEISGVEDAAWLSEEGYYRIMDRVEKAGYTHLITEYYEEMMGFSTIINRARYAA